MNNFYLRLKFIREINGLSQKKFADKLGVPQQNIARYDLGKVKRLDFNFAKKVSELFHIDTEWLLSGSGGNRGMKMSECIRFSKGMKPSVVAAKMDVHEGFIRAIINGDICPSYKFAEKFYSTFDIQNPEKIENKTSKIPSDTLTDIELLRLENARLQGNLDSERRLNEALQLKVDELIRENERLKKGVK